MTAVDLPRETENPTHRRGQPVRGTKQIRRRIPGYGPLRIASGVYTDGDFRRVDEACQAAGAAGRRDWLDALVKGQRKPIELANALREVKMRAAQLPDPITLPFTEEVVLDWLARATGRYAAETLRQMKLKLLALAGAKIRVSTREGQGRDAWHVAENWTNRMDELPAILRLEKKRYALSQSYTSFRLTKAHLLAYLKDNLGKSHPIYREASDVTLFSRKEVAKAPRKLTLLNLPIADALRFADRLYPVYRQPWVTMLLTGANPKELWDDGMTFDLATGGIFIDGEKRGGRKRKVPRITLHWRGVTYSPELHRPRCAYKTFVQALRNEYDAFAKPYDARRSYSAYLGEARLDPVAAVSYMGHTAPNQTMAYMMADGEYAQDKASLLANGTALTAWLQEQLRLTDVAELSDNLTDTAVSAG